MLSSPPTQAARYRHALLIIPLMNGLRTSSSGYYVDNTEMYYLPSPVIINIDTVVNGKKINANVEKGVAV